MSAMLCLESTVGVWGNEIVPALVAGGAQIRLRPTIPLVPKEVIWRPVMILRAVGAAYLALVPRSPWLNFKDLNSSSFDELFRDEVCCAMAAVAHEEMLN